MFSPGTKRLNSSSRRGGQAAAAAPATPATEKRVPNRPSTGTPAPWAPRLSVLARVSAAKEDNEAGKEDPTKPVFIGEFPHVLRDEQAILCEKHSLASNWISGGMDRGTSLSWIISGDKVFIWDYLLPSSSKGCTSLTIPSSIAEAEGSDTIRHQGSGWLLCFVKWDRTLQSVGRVAQERKPMGVVMCNKKTQSVIYWHDIYSNMKTAPVISVVSEDELGTISTPSEGNIAPKWQRQSSRVRSSSTGPHAFNSLIVSPVLNDQEECVALACSNKGDIWQFHCSRYGIRQKIVYKCFSSSHSQENDTVKSSGGKGYPRSLVWCCHHSSLEDISRQFFLLTDNEIQCFTLKLSSDLEVSKLWSDLIIGDDDDLGIKKGLAGQKQIWPLDVQVDEIGRVITVLVAILCKDRVSGSSYTQYSLLTMQCKSRLNISSDIEGPIQGRILENKAPIQVIIPKARLEKDEDFSFSMRLRVGGRPPGSIIILSADGTATVSHYYRNSIRLYQFDLPYDAGKVLDASVLPSADDSEEGSWVVLTVKAGIWAIPEKAVVLGGVEPLERSLFPNDSSNGRSTQEERNKLTFSGEIALRRSSSDTLDSGDKQRTIIGIARHAAQDEESEALLNHLFHDFLFSGQVDGSFEKLKNAGAFDREGEANVFARTSKSIVDTLAKHWTTTRGAEIVSMAVVSTQLKDKQQKHQKFLQFLALSKCHEELCSKQRNSLQIILAHGEKLAGMIRLRELQHIISHSRSKVLESSYSGSDYETVNALWNLIQVVGERARRNIVLLMDRDNSEVFYSKVSDLEEVFYCLEKQLDYLVSLEQPVGIQVRRAFELSDACVTIIRTAMDYRKEYHLWYPPPEGLAPWYCQLMVRNGLWSLASFMLQRLNETTFDTLSAKSMIFTLLEALTKVLLEAYTGAITAKVERGEQEKALLEEYWNRRDALLDSLYRQIKDVSLTRQQGSIEVGGQQGEVYKDLLSRLLCMGKQHECYSTLWNVCCDLNDTVLLKNLMQESAGPKAGFSYYVFKQLYARQQFSKILRLGEEFPEELAIFLKQNCILLWLHEVYLHQFPLASENLHRLALSQDESFHLEAEEEAESDYRDLSLIDRKRFLNLAKIAALASNDEDQEAKMKRLEADLRILKLQEGLMEHLDEEAKQNIGRQLLRPEDLIVLCLSSNQPGLTLQAFEIFAWTSSSFRRRERALLENCWKNAADGDDWGELYHASTAEGWSDEQTLGALRSTILFQASCRCYGPEAETFGGRFDEVMPLRQEGSESRDLECSVEAILMQHKFFPDAGKLMLTAIELGSLHGTVRKETSPVPME
ncbi:hypothetical protein SAY87_009938 [Trapa incisa]|uniref:Nucleoporin Nup133/Nup155-like N-terminal domain-containing protein n=1 Tax=Trapa incisa TaxID=236973 RepID=A0AAN7GH20_9MYRT|nr:hypothetical protein SAY87_009938 [Trapa incisa]